MKHLLFCGLVLCLVVDLHAEAPRADRIAFFKQSTGTWKGSGTSVVGPNKSKLEVTDNWKGGFEMEGSVFVQLGTVDEQWRHLPISLGL